MNFGLAFFLISLLSVSAQFHNKVQLTSGYSLAWTANLVTNTIQFQAVVNTTGWIGFGLSPIPILGFHGMGNADIWIGIWDTNTGALTVKDYYRNESYPGEPEEDTTLGGTNDVSSFTGSQSNGVSIITWTRSLTTKDIRCDHPFTGGLLLNVIYAWGTSKPCHSNVLEVPHAYITFNRPHL